MKRLRRLPPTSSAASGKSSASATAIAAKRAVAGVLAGTLTLMSSLASAAPAQRVHVVQLTPAVRSQVDQAIRLTHALEAKISYVPGVQFINSKKDLLSLLYKEAKCSLRFAERALNEKPPLDAYADQLFDEPCRQKVATLLARPPAEAYVWGWLFQDPHHSNRDTVTVHLWRNGQADRSVTLPYQSSERALDVLAKRLALRLVDPDQVGEGKLTATAAGDLYIDGVAYGPWDPTEPDVTTLAGAHAFELRTTQGTWRGQGEIVSGQQRNITLTAHVAPTSTVATTTRPASSKEAPSSAWPWVFGTVGVVGLVGSGVFLGLGQKANTDVRNASACGPTTCFSEQTSLDRAKLYDNTLAPVSLGVGLVGSGLLTWWLLRTPTTKTTAQKSQQKHHWTGSIAPTRSGLAATVQGEF